ncbi:MAG: methyltransferase domain-containing protein [Candidatus Omnitrophica bacterium]|nr:methyltransferase domain-containing protein [Candidatus Omnitrophota bacterium]
MTGLLLKHMIDHLEIFVCPACGKDLAVCGDTITCAGCKNTFSTESGIPLLFWPNEWDSSKRDVTHVVKSFYEKTPFPNYEKMETTGDLIEKAESGIFARLLNEQIPFNTRVLEVGCGTGQLTNYLGIAHRFLFGADMCFNSLKLANDFREKNRIDRTGFYQMNLFSPIFKKESFSLVISNGVLHHTSDPFGGFKSIARLVKKGGYIIIGLYNKYGRLTTDARRIVFNLLGDRLTFLDPYLRKSSIGDLKKFTWFMDQYKNPHESKHTIGEVMRWFDDTGFDFVNSIPKSRALSGFHQDEKLFKPNPKGSRFDHFCVQAQLLLTGKNEGGFFVMIGRKR